MIKIKKHLTHSEEFEIMKIVLDKFLWIGTIIMIYGLYTLGVKQEFKNGILAIISGTIIMLLFRWIIIKNFEFSS